VNILRRLFGRAPAEPDEATAFPITFNGKGAYSKSFDGAAGVVLEDDGETGYLYATSGDHSEIWDALHLYDRNDPHALRPDDEVFVVWNAARRRAGIYYREEFHGVYDFRARRGACRTGFPPRRADGKWSDWPHVGRVADKRAGTGVVGYNSEMHQPRCFGFASGLLPVIAEFA
jgi:hypothetical protein